MSCSIYINKREVLECSVGVLEDFYYEFQDIIQEENVKTNLEFDHFMVNLYEAIITHGGVPIDIANLFTIPDNLFFLINLLRRTITKIESSLKDYAVVAVYDFYNELVQYHKELVLKNN